MPELREVFEMATKQVEPDLGSWNEQERRQRRTIRNRKIGTYVVTAAIGVAAVAAILAHRGAGGPIPADRPQPTSTPPATAVPGAAALTARFVEAFGAFDGERAITYLSDSPTLQMDATIPEEVPTFTTFLEAMGYEQIVTEGCFVTGTSASGTAVRCPFEWNAIRSDEMGLGPYPGRWDFNVRDGEVAAAALSWRLGRFSPQVWEPFRDWVRQNYPKDFDVMYVGDGANFSLTRRSARLWEEHSRGYVQYVNEGTA